MRPIARVLLANGIAYTEFDEACRRAFVTVASEEFGLRGRTTNTSRISVMTGLSRKEVHRLKRISDDDESESTKLLSPLADLLRVWWTSEEYQDATGRPKSLQIGGRLENSFDDLVRSCIGDVPPGAVKKELIRLGVVEADKANRLWLKSRALIPSDTDARLEMAFLYSLRGLAETIAHNHDPRVSADKRRIERFVTSRPLAKAEIAKLSRLVWQRLSAVSEELDSLLSDREPPADDAETHRVGVGLFYTES
jgi:hypothetical protein